VSTNLETSEPRQRGIIYAIAIGLLVVFAVIALITFKSARDTEQAQQKADELIASIEADGGTAPSANLIAGVLGDDGGSVCQDPNSGLAKAALLGALVNGSGGPGSRPIIAEGRLLEGQLRIISIYCPDELDDFQDFVDSLETTETNTG
jgi:hypothetical protein